MSAHSPKRVALFASSFQPHLGGVEELVRQLATQLQKEGGAPAVFTMRWPKSLPAIDQYDGIPIRRHIFRLPERHPRWLAAYAVDQRRVQRSVNRQLRDLEADLVHVQCVSGNGWYALRAARSLGLPLVVTLQGELTMDATNVYARSHVLPKLLARLMREADAVTACSHHTLQEAEDFTGVRLGVRGHVIHNGVSLAEIQGAEPEVRERPYLFALGRHVIQKGFDDLLRAYAILRTANASVPDLVLAGEGPETTALQALARSLGIGDHVAFVGRTDRARTGALFAGCCVFVLPSRHEPQGIVILEAMAAAKPVVATRVGGVPEIVVDNETGQLVSAESPDELARGIMAVLESPDRAAMAERGRLRAAEFDWPLVADRYRDLYEQCAQSRASAGAAR